MRSAFLLYFVLPPSAYCIVLEIPAATSMEALSIQGLQSAFSGFAGTDQGCTSMSKLLQCYDVVCQSFYTCSCAVEVSPRCLQYGCLLLLHVIDHLTSLGYESVPRQ